MGFSTFDQRNVQCVGSLFWQEAVFIRLKNEMAKNNPPKTVIPPTKMIRFYPILFNLILYPSEACVVCFVRRKRLESTLFVVGKTELFALNLLLRANMDAKKILAHSKMILFRSFLLNDVILSSEMGFI